jgi:RecA/RadA recombinase
MTLPAETAPDESHLWALHYAYNQLRVLPIKPGEKRPPMAAWQNAATTDPAIVDAWWTELYRGHGVGIATGRGSGVFVLDVDVADGKTGDETLAELEATHGPLPDTWTAITGSGGTHYYFALPLGVEIRNDAGRRLGPGLDIRGEGGQVVAPPTMGRLQRYEWERDVDTPLADPPGWLVELLTATPEAPTPPPAQPVDDGDSVAGRYNARTTWAELLGRDGWTLVATMPDGEQRWTRPGKDPRDGISATTGHEGRDCLTVFTSSIPSLPEGTYSRFGYSAAVHHGGDRSAFARLLRTAEGPGPLPELASWSPLAGHTDTTTRLELAHLVDWNRFWDDDHSDEEWLAYPVVPTGRAIALYAPAKTGKSMVTLAIAAAVATGRPVLGRRLHPIVDVLYLDYEMTQADLQQRLMELGYGPDDDMSHLHYALLPSLPPLDTVEGATAILELIDTTGAQFVVVDTFGRAVGGEEDHADTVRAFYRHTGLSLKARGVTYLRTDHSGKDVSKGMRGSSAKNDDVDLVWQLTRADTKDGHGVRLTRTHSRVAWVPETVKVLRKETEDGFEFVIDGQVTLRPDGTRQIMEQMVAAGVTADMGQRRAEQVLKDAGIKVKQKAMRDALAMLKETVANGHMVIPEVTPFVPAQARQDSDAVASAQARQISDAMGTFADASDAPKGRLASRSDALDATADAVEPEYRVTRASLYRDALTHQRDEHDPDDLPDLF